MKRRTPFGFYPGGVCAAGVGAVAVLREKGCPRLWNRKGGILAWAGQVDPSIPTY